MLPLSAEKSQTWRLANPVAWPTPMSVMEIPAGYLLRTLTVEPGTALQAFNVEQKIKIFQGLALLHAMAGAFRLG